MTETKSQEVKSVSYEDAEAIVKELRNSTPAQAEVILENHGQELKIRALQERAIERLALPFPSKVAHWAEEKWYLAYPKAVNDGVTVFRNVMYGIEKVAAGWRWMFGGSV